MTLEATPWTETFHVRTYEADPSGCASMQVLCNYLQEAAANHAQRLGVSVEHLVDQQQTWVLAYLRVEVETYPRWRDAVHVETWPSGENGLYATREFLLRGHDDRPLGRATSAWLLLDLERRRPLRISERVREIRVPARPRPLPGPIPRLQGPSQAEYEQSFHVRYSDLDMNRHVNNVRYIDWAVESAAREAAQDLRLQAVEISFRAETRYGDAVLAQAQQAEHEDGILFLHRLAHAGDGREVALAKTRWGE